MRSIFGAVFPLFAYYMFEGIGIQWGMTFLGCLATLFIPMPFVRTLRRYPASHNTVLTFTQFFYFYGKKIRAKSKFAPAPDIAQDKRRDEEARGGGQGDENGEKAEDGAASQGVENENGMATASGSSQSDDIEKRTTKEAV